MSTPKQATLNQWVNPEAIIAYAERMRRWGQQEHIEGRPYLAAELEQAATALYEAVRLAIAADRKAGAAMMDRVYHREETA